MPTYQYTCADCGEPVEVVQKFTDEPLTVCAACGGRLRKVFSPVGIVFKGSGFYRTDSRKGSPVMPSDKPDKAGKQSSEVGASASSSNGSDSASSGKESKPAAKKPGETVTAPSKSSSSSEKVA